MSNKREFSKYTLTLIFTWLRQYYPFTQTSDAHFYIWSRKYSHDPLLRGKYRL